MELYELTIDDKVDEVFAISLVENPAIESDFIFFGKEQIQFAKVDTEQRMLIGPVLIPDKKILRVDGEGKPYNVFLSKETVKKVAQNYLMKKYTDKATLEHDKTIKGVHLVESWIKDSKLDKSNGYGLALPEGTWVGMFQITDEKLWQDYIKTGMVKGFSIEGLFSHKLIKASMIDESILEKEITQLTEEEALVVLKKLKYSIKSDKRFKSGKTMLEETHSDYPDGVKSNAKKALEWANTNGWGSCGTPVGKQRANQLAKGEPISVDTIKRMYSFLSRHEGDLQSSTAYGDGCGKLMYDAWGGKAALGWSRNKLRTLGLLNESEGNPSIPNSSYPGETPKKNKYIHPALIGTNK